MAGGPQEAVSAVILAGGRSRRMGREKATVPLAGRTLLQRTIDAVEQVRGLAEVILVLAPEQAEPQVECRVPLVIARDEIEGEGPLAGLARGLAAAVSPVYLVLGCDTPFVRPALLELLAERAREQVVVMPIHRGLAQPLCSAGHREVLPTIEALLVEGNRAASALADLAGALLLPESEWRDADPEARSFVGVNTPEELAEAERLLARLEAEASH